MPEHLGVRPRHAVGEEVDKALVEPESPKEGPKARHASLQAGVGGLDQRRGQRRRLQLLDLGENVEHLAQAVLRVGGQGLGVVSSGRMMVVGSSTSPSQ